MAPLPTVEQWYLGHYWELEKVTVCLQLSRRCSNHLCNKNRGFENFLLATYNMSRGIQQQMQQQQSTTPVHKLIILLPFVQFLLFSSSHPLDNPIFYVYQTWIGFTGVQWVIFDSTKKFNVQYASTDDAKTWIPICGSPDFKSHLQQH